MGKIGNASGGSAKAAPKSKAAGKPVTAQEKSAPQAAAAAPKEKPSLLEEAQQKWADDERDERLRSELRETNRQIAKNGVKFDGNRDKGLVRIQKFQNKLRAFKGASELDAVVKDIDGVDASKFVPELSDDIMEAAGVSVKLKDIFSVVNICSRLNGTYEEFRGALAKSLDKTFSSLPASDLNRRRFLLRLSAELCLVECIPAASSPLLKMVQQISDVSVSDEQVMANFSVIASLVQKHAWSCLNITPNKQKSYEEVLGKPWISRTVALSSELQMRLAQLITGAYRRAAGDLQQRVYSEMLQQERLNSKQKTAESEQKLQQHKETFEKLQSNIVVLSEYLNLALPEPPEDDPKAGNGVKVENGTSQAKAAPKRKKKRDKDEASDAEEDVDLVEVSHKCRGGTNYEDLLVELTREEEPVTKPSKKDKAKSKPAEEDREDELLRLMVLRAQQDDGKKKTEAAEKDRALHIEVVEEEDKDGSPEMQSKEGEQNDDTAGGGSTEPQSPVDAYLSSLSKSDHQTVSVHDALHNVLSAYDDVDEDTVESLVEMVTDARAENKGDAREFSPCLEELLEPFLLAFGCDPESIPLDCMKIAVGICGVPELQVEAKSEPSTSSGKLESSVQPGAPQPSGTSVTLAEMCTTGAGQPASGYPKQKKTASSTASSDAKAKSKPKTLGSMLAVNTDDTFGVQTGLVNASADNVSSDEDAEAKSRNMTASEKKKAQKEQSRARRLELAEAAANRPQVAEDLSQIAAHGLQENSVNSTSASSQTKGNRGVHVEGKGSRNIHLEDVSIVISGDQGSHEVLRGSDLHLSAGHIYGLVGRNGSGKTTLLRRLGAKAIPGMPQHFRFGYVAQELAALQGGQTPIEAVVNADKERLDLLKEREELEALLEGAEALTDAKDIAKAEEHAQRFTEVEQQLEAIDADGAEDRAEDMLALLSFSQGAMKQPMDKLSGGWRMRVALACALSSQNDVLLLDEPTNHLDLHGVLWLQETLYKEWGEGSKKKDRIVVIVSHDRSFLDACATDILEIHDCKLRTFTGNYTSYLERVAEEHRLSLLKKAEMEKQDKIAAQEMRAMKKVARQHKDEKKVRQLKSKEKKMEKASQLCSAREFGADHDDIRAKLREDPSLRFRFPDVDTTWDEESNFLEVDNASVRQGGTEILRKVTLTVQPGSRIAIVGSNGAGKSTLMQALAGDLPFEEGRRGRGRKHAQYKPGFVSQNHLESQASGINCSCLQFLRNQLPGGENLRHGDGIITQKSDDSVLRALLSRFGMGNDALKKVGYLSGGQKARLSLATSTWWGPNTLLLDEPTNHLDIDSLDALSIGLQAYEGAVIVVSHNQGFLETLCDELWIVQDGTVKVCPKGDEAFVEFFNKYVKEVQKSLK